jgi:hypothetical protein
MGMMGSCAKVGGILVLLGGLSFAAVGLGMLDWGTGSLVGGFLIALYGAAMLYHSMGMCESCKAGMMGKMSKK